MAMWEEDFEILPEELFEDDGFWPGLRPRGHEAVLDAELAARLAAADALFGAARADEPLPEIEAHVGVPGPRPAVPAELQGVRSEPVLKAGVSGGPGECRQGSTGSHRSPAGGSEAGVEAPGPRPTASVEPVDAVGEAEVRRNLRRLGSARRAVLAFTADNDRQRELQALLLRIFDHLRQEHCRPGRGVEFEHWWAVVRIYRRILAAPELARTGAWTLLEYLLSLTAEELGGRRLELASGRRKLAPLLNQKKKRRSAKSRK